MADARLGHVLFGRPFKSLSPFSDQLFLLPTSHAQTHSTLPIPPALFLQLVTSLLQLLLSSFHNGFRKRYVHSFSRQRHAILLPFATPRPRSLSSRISSDAGLEKPRGYGNCITSSAAAKKVLVARCQLCARDSGDWRGGAPGFALLNSSCPLLTHLHR